MDVNKPLPLLGMLTPAQFMQRHWQKKPLLVRGAVPAMQPLLTRAELFKLASQDQVESRLIVRDQTSWRMSQGPFKRSRLPPLNQPGWTLLVQGVDGHHQGVHGLLQQFRFVPDARLDDLMISFASDGGGVGPHFDSYDVFLIQASGRRRWKISKQKDLTLQPDVPLKILQNFEAEEEFVLEAGDMLYLPPLYAHEGIAETAGNLPGQVADCMTYSIGFRAPAEKELAAELLHRLAEFVEDDTETLAADSQRARLGKPTLYRDAAQLATDQPAALPEALLKFAAQAVKNALSDPLALACTVGENLTSLKPSVWFEEADQAWQPGEPGLALSLHRQTRMMYDANHLFINGESHRAAGADARLMHLLANQRMLSARQLQKASPGALALLADWHEAGWLNTVSSGEAPK